ncbi:MAG: YbbR-like domain-containing protein [Paludibacter sp.]|nr:YbbR-like domain-containing protein [Paludibacter sp.]
MAEKNGNRLHIFKIEKLKSFFLSKDILSFLLFLVMSGSFWFVNSLGKDRETTISIPIRYVGIPQNIAITNSPPTKISLSVKDQGLHLLSYSHTQLTPLAIDLSRVFYQKGEILITSDQLNGRIKRYMKLQPTTSILEVQPDSILVQYEKLSMKTLPIVFVSKIELAHQYILSDKILLEPSTVTVFGPKRALDKLKSIRTELKELKNLSDTSILICRLKPERSVRYSTKEIKVSIFVELFTEKKIQIPITEINCPNHLSIRTFPAVVNATYSVGLSHFNSYKINDIQVLLDYNDIKNNKTSKIKLKVINNTTHISSLRISPQEVEFILEEK